jgi:uncharacterized protein (TIGR02996 family)
MADDTIAARLFEFHEGASDKFWIIELAGDSHTVRYGRQGTDGQTKTKEFGSPDEARKSYDKLIAQKVKKGYVEATSQGESRGAQLQVAETDVKEQEPFLAEIRDNPDDPAVYAVFADWLSEKGDPRGEFMSIQLQLEDSSLNKDARQELQKQEKVFLKEHERDLLGDLAPFLIDQEGKEHLEWHRGPLYSYQFARGFLDSVTVHYLLPDFSKALCHSPLSSELKRFTIEHLPTGDELAELPVYANEGWGYDDSPSLDGFRGCQFECLQHFEVNTENYYGPEESIMLPLRGMPRLRTLELTVDVDTDTLFSMTLPFLRSISVDHLKKYPLDGLAKNHSLTQLEAISFFPHAVDPGDEPYIQLSGLKAICRSKYLKALKRITLFSASFGDDGISEIIDSGLISRLTQLDLSHGCVTDAGAERLAACDLSGLQRLTLDHNFLSKRMVEKLTKEGVNLSAQSQSTGNPAEDDEYLYAGSWE